MKMRAYLPRAMVVPNNRVGLASLYSLHPQHNNLVILKLDQLFIMFS